MSTVGIDENFTPDDIINRFNIFPNPATNHTSIEIEMINNGSVAISLCSLKGKLLKQIFSGERNIGTHQFEISCSNLSKGVYL